ncbi:nitroreductase family protein [Klenkia brasiliensis]|nr:nitroreductase family protein [Klenkia brasiliensis]
MYAVSDAARFWRGSSLSTFDSSRDQIHGRTLYFVHSIEKGLAQSRKWEPRRGTSAIRNLSDSLARCIELGYGTDSFAFDQGISVIQRYRERHEAADVDTQFLDKLLHPIVLAEERLRARAGAGTQRVTSELADEVVRDNFYSLFKRRVSIREFTGEPIDPNGVERSIQSALKTPSVCNRQAWSVFWCEDKQTIARILQHQRGFAYDVMPEILLTITCSNAFFISPVERNQGFVDGGLFSMSVLLGLEAEGLGAVPLNACLYRRDRREVVRILGADPADEIILFIAVGARPETSEIPVADRKPLAGTIKMVKND